MRGLKGHKKEGNDSSVATSSISARATALGPTKTIKRLRNARGSLPQFQYAPNRLLDLTQVPAGHIQMRVCASHIAARNDGIRKRLLWGPTVDSKNSIFEYTNDSDMVAMLVHSGHIALPRSRSTNQPFSALLVTLKVLRGGSPKFISYEQNNIRSRAWEGRYSGARIAISRVVALDTSGAKVALPPHVVVRVVNPIPRLVMPEEPVGSSAPSSTSGSAAASNIVASEAITFDLSNRPCLVFTLTAVADRGSDRTLWPSKRLSREVMYVESDEARYEISRTEAPERRGDGVEKRREDGKEKKKGLYVRFAEVNRKVVKREMFEDELTPAPLKEWDLVSSAVYKWSALKWDAIGLSVGGVHYELKRVSFRPKRDHADEQEDSNQVHTSSHRMNTNTS